MIAFLLLFVALGRLYRDMFKQPETRALLVMALVVILIGVVFYVNVEHWSVVDAIYFSVVTLGTVGYGDITPTTDVGKIFTVFYILFGLGVIGGFFATLGRLIDPQQFLSFKRPLHEATKVQEELTHVIHRDEAAETRKDDEP